MNETLDTIVITRVEYDLLLKASEQTMNDVHELRKYPTNYTYGEKAYRQAKLTRELIGCLVDKEA